MPDYRELTDRNEFERFALFNLRATGAGDAREIEQMMPRAVDEIRRSKNIGIYDSGELIGSIVMMLTPPFFMLDAIPQSESQKFLQQENITAGDCVQMLYAVFPNRSGLERLAFYKRNLEEMIAPGKEHILIFYTDDKHNRHQLYRRMKPEIIAQKEYPGFSKRLVFVRRSHLLKELQRVEQQLHQRRNYKLPELQTF